MAHDDNSSAIHPDSGAPSTSGFTADMTEYHASSALYAYPSFTPPPDPVTQVQHSHPHANSYGFAPPPMSLTGDDLQPRPVTEPPSLQLPGHLQDLCAAYVASYDDDANLDSSQMDSARALALGLLQHYYPASEGYLVQPSALGLIAKYGLNFMLKADDGSDPQFNALPAIKDPKKGKNRKPSRAQQTSEYLRQFNHLVTFATSVRWYMIKPENIAGFEVMKKVPGTDGDKDNQHRPYTYLAIMLDDLQNLSFFSENNDVQRGDILTEVLCRSQHIRAGHGLLLFGTRLEMYLFDNGAPLNPDANSKTSTEEPHVTLCKDVNGTDLAVDLRTTGMHTVDRMLREITSKGVKYLDSSADAGDQKVDAVGQEDNVDMGYVVSTNTKMV